MNLKQPLSEIGQHLVEVAKTINYDDEFALYENGFKKQPNVKKWLLEPNGLYYSILAAYCKTFNVITACEIGAMYGGSALALRKFCPLVESYDIDLSNIFDEKLKDKISFIKLNGPTDCVNIDFSSYDVIFIDIGDHTGELEKQIHEVLNNTFNGIAFWDDIYWTGMKPFWESITNEKHEFPSRQSGFGMVRYVNAAKKPAEIFSKDEVVEIMDELDKEVDEVLKSVKDKNDKKTTSKS